MVSIRYDIIYDVIYYIMYYTDEGSQRSSYKIHLDFKEGKSNDRVESTGKGT